MRRLTAGLMVAIVLAFAAQAEAQQGQNAWPLDYNYGDVGPQNPIWDRPGYTLKVNTLDFYSNGHWSLAAAQTAMGDYYDFWCLGYSVFCEPDNQFDAVIMSSSIEKASYLNWEIDAVFRCWWWDKN